MCVQIAKAFSIIYYIVVTFQYKFWLFDFSENDASRNFGFKLSIRLKLLALLT